MSPKIKKALSEENNPPKSDNENTERVSSVNNVDGAKTKVEDLEVKDAQLIFTVYGTSLSKKWGLKIFIFQLKFFG